MSVDPDDRTPLAIKNTGARIVSYGAPVLPGAMFLLSYLPDGRPVCGLPGCVMYAKRTIFDLVLPKLIARVEIKAAELAALGNGGLCLNCPNVIIRTADLGKEFKRWNLPILMNAETPAWWMFPKKQKLPVRQRRAGASSCRRKHTSRWRITLHRKGMCWHGTPCRYHGNEENGRTDSVVSSAAIDWMPREFISHPETCEIEARCTVKTTG